MDPSIQERMRMQTFDHHDDVDEDTSPPSPIRFSPQNGPVATSTVAAPSAPTTETATPMDVDTNHTNKANNNDHDGDDNEDGDETAKDAKDQPTSKETATEATPVKPKRQRKPATSGASKRRRVDKTVVPSPDVSTNAPIAPQDVAVTTQAVATVPVAPSSNGFNFHCPNCNHVLMRAGACAPLIFTSPTTLFPFPTGPVPASMTGIPSLMVSAQRASEAAIHGVPSATPNSTAAPMDVDDAKSKGKKKGKKKSTDPPNKPDWPAYRERITALLKTKTPEWFAATQGNGISDFLMFGKDKLGKITDPEELKFVQEADLRQTSNLKKFKTICERVQYHGLFLKHICACNRLYLGRFINETAKVVDDKVVFVDNSDADLKQRADGKVMFVGVMAGNGPNNPKPTVSDFRLMNKDRIRVVPDTIDTPTSTSTSSTSVAPATPSPKRKYTRRSSPPQSTDNPNEENDEKDADNDNKETSPKRRKVTTDAAAAPPPPSAPATTTPPKRGKSPRKTVAAAPTTIAVRPANEAKSIPPPTVTKNPILITSKPADVSSNAGPSSSVGARTVSIPLQQEVAKAAISAAKASVVAMNGHSSRSKTLTSGGRLMQQEQDPDD